ncbi:MAG: hypothetical protein RMJ65_06005, partial [candidate division WOR-3 bacterium]|nr:hypothetical protein [candidate division WOR-3 bacterium]
MTLNLFLPLSSTDDALANFTNPAALSQARDFNCYYLYNFDGQNLRKNHVLVAQVKNLGVSLHEFKYLKFGCGISLMKPIALGASYYKVS